MKNLLAHKYTKPIILILYIISISIFANSRDLFFGDEVRYADVYSHLKEGNFLSLTLNGEPYPDKPPLFFIFIYFIQIITGITSTKVFFIATMITGIMFISSSYYFLKLTTNDENLSFYSNMLLTSNLYFIALVNFVKMDLLFSFFIILSFSYFYIYSIKKRYRYLYVAFLMSGIAVMVKGLLGIVFPMFSFIIYSILKKEYNCLLNIHFILGFIISLIPTLLWIYALIQINGFDYVYNSIFYQQTVRRAVDAFHSKKPFYFYIYVLPLVWLPISVTILVKIKILKETFIELFKKNGDGYQYITITFIVTFFTLSLISSKFANYLLPLFPQFSLFLYFLLIKNYKNRTIWITISTIFIFIAIAIISFAIYNSKHNLIPEVKYSWLIAVSSIFLALYILKNLSYETDKLIISYSIWIIIFTNVLIITFVTPASGYFSPRKIGETLKFYAEKGYKPISFDTYSGTYSYYSSRPVLETRDRKIVEELLYKGEKIVIAMSEKNWKRWDNKPQNLKIVKKQFMMNKFYLVLIN